MRIVIVSCGAKKHGVSCLAGEMYLGCYHRLCRTLAKQLVGADRIYILSAKYGLLPLDRVIDPYNLRMGQPGSITSVFLYRQAAALGLLGATVVVLGGKAYLDRCRAVWNDCRTPLQGRGGIGKQLRELKRLQKNPTEVFGGV